MRSAASAVVLLLAAACAADPPPAPAPPDPVAACTGQLTYWAGQLLHGVDDGYDYQHMGLTGEQFDALRAVVDRARTDGPMGIEAQARAACARIAAGPAEAPWGTGGS